MSDVQVPTGAASAEIPAWFSSTDLEEAARRRLPPDVFDYIAGGAGEERSLQANRAGFGRVRLRPRVLVDVSKVDTGATLLGHRLAAPILIAPMGSQGLVHPHGERATAAAAAATGLGYILSMTSTFAPEEVAAVAADARWFQLYVMTRDRGLNAEIVGRAAAAGFTALVVTVDAPVPGNRRRDLRHLAAGSTLLAGFQAHTRYGLPPVAPGDPFVVSSLTWADIDWLVRTSRLPVLLKGVMTAEDARLAADCGVAGLVVSNHGGRQLDNTFATIEVLPEIAAAVGGRIPVLVDGGVRNATDIAAALALGAAAVGIGRPVLWALAGGGEHVVTGYLRGLMSQLAATMALLGVRAVGELTPAHVGWAST
jgi:isopentenyl diphosphate isomerase/L-lactate dehydrogenase-like FMN-dependent dehydrogenase